ncbi:hypothetical protein POX_c04621 [Penicillium oxalicum]|nr:hypothetical protein POX_c04621 [Penicillium oxalicum]KAI2791743.1 hypothetical protein POX_c04621 [Penicillium oxalicum]
MRRISQPTNRFLTTFATSTARFLRSNEQRQEESLGEGTAGYHQ